MARNVAATNAGVGSASISTRVKLTWQAMKRAFMFGALPMLILPYFLWEHYVTPQGFDIVKMHLLSKVVEPNIARKWHMRDAHGESKIVTVMGVDGAEYQYLTPGQIKELLRASWGAADFFDMVFYASLVASVLGYLALWRIFTSRGLAQQSNKRIRGASDLVGAKELNRLVRKKNVVDYTLLDVALPAKSAMQGILAIGAQGSGKSLAIHDFMQQVFAKKRKCIIYDPSGEFYRAYFRPGKDLFFNPACVGSIAWSIFEELKNTYDANTLAQAFLPPKALSGQAGANGFFEDAARALFSVILLRLAQRGAVNTKDIATAFLEMPEDEMNTLIQKSVASSAIAGDSKGQRQGVIASISIYLDGILSANEGNWSIREFLESEGDGCLFLFGTEDTKAMFAPLYRLLLSVAFSAIGAKQEVIHEDKYWFFLDEIHTLGDIRVDEQLATLRKYGVCVFAGTQNDSQFITSVGKDKHSCFLRKIHIMPSSFSYSASSSSALSAYSHRSCHPFARRSCHPFAYQSCRAFAFQSCHLFAFNLATPSSTVAAAGNRCTCVVAIPSLG